MCWHSAVPLFTAYCLKMAIAIHTTTSLKIVFGCKHGHAHCEKRLLHKYRNQFLAVDETVKKLTGSQSALVDDDIVRFYTAILGIKNNHNYNENM